MAWEKKSDLFQTRGEQMNSNVNQKRMLLIAFFLGTLLSIVFFRIITNMETSMENENRTAFEGVGIFQLVIPIVLVLLLILAAVEFRNSRYSQQLNFPVNWSLVSTILVFSIFLFFIGFFSGFILFETKLWWIGIFSLAMIWFTSTMVLTRKMSDQRFIMKKSIAFEEE
jgi:membrane-associated HD superfamily phosphohydrolase